MDHLPKFRRKPKIPTISTTDVKPLPSRNGGGIIEQDQQLLSPQPIYPSTVTITGGRRSPTTTKPGLRKSAFRGLHLRSPGKRARSPSPASLPLSPSPAIVFHDGFASSSPTSTRYKDGTKDDAASGKDSQESARTKRKIPAFLNLPFQGTQGSFRTTSLSNSRGLGADLRSRVPDQDNKFHELVWLERNRLAASMVRDSEENTKWGVYKQTDLRRGTQDRYFNIKPWNHNRVKLRVPAGELDYVNASNISLTSPSNKNLPPLRYIAMQGPTQASLDFVWRMVAEQLSTPAVIVQLTSMFENNQAKCFPYLPMDESEGPWIINESNGWNDGWRATLSFDSFQSLENGAIELRKLLLRVCNNEGAEEGEENMKGEEEERVVWHFLYTKWPDFGVPAVDDVSSFFKLMRLSREYNTAGPENPRIIHCSAGVGRTGTFITLEHLMRELDEGALGSDNYDGAGDGDDLIFSTVNALREQRRSMVQAEAQYVFLYQVLRKLWMEKHDIDESDDDESEPAPKRLEVEELSTDWH